MFWRRGSEKENKEQNGVLPSGQVRVLVVGDAGVGKTSLVHLITKGSSCARPPQTIGCNVGVKDTSDTKTVGPFFIPKSMVRGEPSCLCSFEKQLEPDYLFKAMQFVYYLRRTKSSLQSWAVEIAANGTFSAPLRSGGPGGLPVPYLVIGNKADIAAKEGTRGSSGNLVDVARQWVEKQGLLSSSDELPLTESFPGGGGLIAAAKEARYDKEAVMKFFRMLIRRRYFADELPAASPWAIPVNNSSQSGEIMSDEDRLYKSTSSLVDESYKYNALPPLPAQRNLTPPPTLYPQQPMSTPDTKYTTIPRYAITSSNEYSIAARSKRTDINV